MILSRRLCVLTIAFRVFPQSLLENAGIVPSHNYLLLSTPCLKKILVFDVIKYTAAKVEVRGSC
jgi:hypothetical protein